MTTHVIYYPNVPYMTCGAIFMEYGKNVNIHHFKLKESKADDFYKKVKDDDTVVLYGTFIKNIPIHSGKTIVFCSTKESPVVSQRKDIKVITVDHNKITYAEATLNYLGITKKSFGLEILIGSSFNRPNSKYEAYFSYLYSKGLKERKEEYIGELIMGKHDEDLKENAEKIGNCLLEKEMEFVKKSVSKARMGKLPIWIKGIRSWIKGIPIIPNLDSSITKTTLLALKMYPDAPFVVGFRVIFGKDGEVYYAYTLRSREGGFDVSKLIDGFLIKGGGSNLCSGGQSEKIIFTIE